MHEPYAIESMPLYVNVDRINNELAALGIGVDEALTPAQLFPSTSTTTMARTRCTRLRTSSA